MSKMYVHTCVQDSFNRAGVEVITGLHATVFYGSYE